MAAEHETDATSYIQHHLTFFAEPVSEQGGFWTIHYDTIVTSIIVGVLVLGFVWFVTRKATSGVPSKTQAFVELTVEFVNDQVKSLFHHDYRLVAPIALTVFLWVLFMNAMDFLPVDIMAWIYQHVFHLHEWRSVPTADVNTTFALSLSVFGLMTFYSIKYAGEIIFLLIGLWAATGITGVIVGGVLHLGWAIFHILIVVLQADIFMMLTVVY